MWLVQHHSFDGSLVRRRHLWAMPSRLALIFRTISANRRPIEGSERSPLLVEVSPARVIRLAIFAARDRQPDTRRRR